jgi:hypothetical protein
MSAYAPTQQQHQRLPTAAPSSPSSRASASRVPIALDGRGRARITDFGLADIAGTIEGDEARVGTAVNRE